MINIKTAITFLILIILVSYIGLSPAVKKCLVSPIFDFECKFLAQFIELV